MNFSNCQESIYFFAARFLTLLVVASQLASGVLTQTEARILVGPNVLVSRETDGVSWEVAIAADPKDPNLLLGTGWVDNATRTGQGSETRTYYSRDGGSTWNTTRFAELIARAASGDPQVAFGRDGSAVHVTLGIGGGTGTYIFRSPDGGLTWESPFRMPVQVDHPQIVADHTGGRFDGNLYFSGLQGGGHDNKGGRDCHGMVYRSIDSGRTWQGPVSAGDRHADPRGCLNSSATPLVLSDGALFVPFHTFGEGRNFTGDPFGFSISTDGGVTFSEQKPLRIKGGGIIQSGGQAFYAIDTSKGPFRDRIYLIWMDRADIRAGETIGPTRILFSYSSDRGETWSKPKRIAADTSIPGDQFRCPTIAVNNQGSVLIKWADERAGPYKKGTGSIQEALLNQRVDRYVIASVDGGETFLPEVRLTSESSVGSKDNLGGFTTVRRAGYLQGFKATKPGVRGIEGGDYAGLTAGADGVFHPLWVDQRTGRLQVWTARVKVEKGPAAGIPSNLVEKDVTDQIEVNFDPMREFPADGTVEVPVRLRNKSGKPIYGPFRVVVESGGSSSGSSETSAILNSMNGKTGAGAEMDYSKALRDFPSLLPGAVTEAVIWRLKKANPASLAYKFKIFGRVE